MKRNTDQMTVIGIIPARYGSTRLPGKPLLKIGDKPIVQHVYEKASAVLKHVIVATDDERIVEVVEGFGGRAVLTSIDHRSGTDRCEEALRKSGVDADVVINIQGDEPFVSAEHINGLISCFEQADTDIATTVVSFHPSSTYEEIANPNVVKVVIAHDARALYFSRSVIPHLRGVATEEYPTRHSFLKHQGMYAYTAKALREISQLPQGELELCESLEQLRWLQEGYCIRTVMTKTNSIGIDTAEDLELARKHMESIG
ncbi:3-deoxy-manno-octulosonate cytidylyltransferase [Porphyromonas sp.]|uniref:3-deoxy-manno-octulosonate cytidylyltransferase n=1 Tax=Porphyromonas sp. TaxID=1924944 RepID=UPI0034C5DBBF